MTTPGKIFITADALLADAFELGARVLDSGFRPTVLVGVWRGGAPVGIAVQELFEVMGHPCEHFAIRTSSYGAGREGAASAGDVRVMGLRPLAELVGAEDRCLIVDDVFDSGRSVEAIIAAMRELMGGACPREIQVATVHYKPRRNRTARVPDHFVRETDAWLVYPHEMQGLSVEEIAEHKTLPDRVLKRLKGQGNGTLNAEHSLSGR